MLGSSDSSCHGGDPSLVLVVAHEGRKEPLKLCPVDSLHWLLLKEAGSVLVVPAAVGGTSAVAQSVGHSRGAGAAPGNALALA